MSETKKTTFNYLTERFFKEDIKAKNYKGLLDEEINSLKSFDDKILNVLKEKNVNKIKDLIKIDLADFEKRLKEINIDQIEIDSKIIVIKILQKVLSSKSEQKKEIVAKIAVMGIQNAGKTSFINYLMGQSMDEKFQETEPTVSVEQRTLKLKDLNLVIWDFGGQESFRNEYLSNPEEFFIDTEVLLYVVDAQDEEHYPDSIEYFYSILEILKKTGVQLRIIIDLHKSDPDVVQDVDFLIKIQWLEEKFTNVVQQFSFPYEFMRSSIFNDVADEKEPEISKNLKKVLSSKYKGIGEPSIRDLVKDMLFIQTKIYLNLMNKMNEILSALSNMPAPAGNTVMPEIPAATTPPPPPPPKAMNENPRDGIQQTIVEELKEMFKKMRMKSE
ncbi:MAG: ADP-ribosylation factor-like protein [Promethearchaeota archaeon]